MSTNKSDKSSRKVKQFSDRFIQSTKHSGKSKSVEEYSEIKSNLILAVSKINAKYFKIRMRANGKLHRVTIGKYPEITLEQARIKAYEIASVYRAGDDWKELQKAETQKKEQQNVVVK